MIALDYAFCLQLGKAAYPHQNFEAFCTTLGQHFNKVLAGTECRLLLKEEPPQRWGILADISLTDVQINEPFRPLPDSIQTVLNDLLALGEFHYHQERHHHLIPLVYRGALYGGLIISTHERLSISPDIREMLSLLISGSIDSHLKDQRLSTEMESHEQTKAQLKNQVYSQKGLLEQLHILHRISMRLWHAHSMDNMLHTAVYECIHSLDIDRMGVFLLNHRSGLMRGTYGTDINGKVTNEQWYCTTMQQHEDAKSTLDTKQHITIHEDAPLYHNSEQVGVGWCATISLWDGDETIGWIACDNLITGTPLKPYHHELLKLLGATMSQHIIQRRAQDDLKALNQSLEYRVATRTAQLEEANQRLNQLSREDSLTRVPNRRMLDERMEEEWRRALRYQTPISILIVDIDHFKQYNDTYGHALGDQCLVDVATALSQTSRRAGSLVARFGGEEFVFLLPGSTREEAERMATRALEAVSKLNIPHEASPVAPFVSISVGGKTVVPKTTDNLQQLFIDADIALYEAKSAGRNQAFVL